MKENGRRTTGRLGLLNEHVSMGLGMDRMKKAPKIARSTERRDSSRPIDKKATGKC